MKTTRRDFVKAAAAAAGVSPVTLAQGRPAALDAFQIARRHAIVRHLPTPNFFEGMLLGNGDIGVCVTVRPDALGLHIGKEDVWDIRVSEDHYQHVVTFAELLKMWEKASEEARRRGQPDMIHLESGIDFLREYAQKTQSSYRKPWPRPWPCGIVWVHWDSRLVRLVRQTLDPSNGLLTILLEHQTLAATSRGGDLKVAATRAVTVRCFVNQTTGHVSVTTTEPAPFVSVAYYPNVDAEAQLPPPEVAAEGGDGFGQFFCYQHLPAMAPTAEQPQPPRSEQDRNFALCGRLTGAWEAEQPTPGPRPRVFLRSRQPQPFRLDLTLCTPRDHAGNVEHAKREAVRLAGVPVARIQQESEQWWKGFWSRAAVEFGDQELERIWYHNQYFLACCLREGKVAPGLFGNWSSGRIGTAWHGDYHMNYNTQQVWWGVFSSNHVEQHLPYVELCENLLPLAESFARENFRLPGAFFPHSAYPVPSRTIAYPAPPWGYEICETPWTVQSLWWHYLYTLDKDFLRRAYPPLRAASRFLTAYAKKESDGKYHLNPTVSPENWGMTADYRLNRDCIMDLALAEFVFDAAVEAARILETDAEERARWAELRAGLAPYPKAQGPHGEVWLDVAGAPTDWVYNIPVTLAPVFPGEQVGIGHGERHWEIARRTAQTVRLEGGNDLVFQPLIRARLGLLDLDWFKREVRYCLLPNGVANDRVRQIDGRYRDTNDFDFMMRMGVWTENLSLPAVLNECLMQSYTGTIHLFTNRNHLGRARFENLRAVGAFLVSAAWDGSRASPVTVLSEKGATLRMANPWDKTAVRVTQLKDNRPVKTQADAPVIVFATEPGRHYLIEPI
jgi:hypothetical protein